MSKYKVKGTDILHNKKLYPAGSEIELKDEDAEKIKDYLIPIQEKKSNTTKNNEKTSKTTTNTAKTTSETIKTTSETTPEVTEETNKEAK
ncbi:MAG TPA: hypothetical protein P5556_00715 [Candidatus Gastranaerophilales bacterium]|nr:hypothetical protein [Candidatus Gastranaerophilales bacterium]